MLKTRKWIWYFSKKIISFFLILFILSIFIFAAARLAPGDPLQSFYGDRVERMAIGELEEARERLGLDEPIYIQYGKWLNQALHGDFGISYKYKQPATQVLQALIGNTLLLGGISYFSMFLLAILLGVLCALHEDTWLDRVICKAGTASFYIPSFWLGLLFILLFSVNLNWLPASGAYDIGKAGSIVNRLRHLILPVAVMILSHLWYYTYMIRNKLLEEIRKDYVLLAKAKGLSKREIIWKHCLRNIAPSIISIMAISVTHILGGTYIVEAVFTYPGIGALSVESVKYHDYNLLMLIVLITGVMVIFFSMIAQSINEIIDPRMKQREEPDNWEKPMNDLQL